MGVYDKCLREEVSGIERQHVMKSLLPKKLCSCKQA